MTMGNDGNIDDGEDVESRGLIRLSSGEKEEERG